jgi:hypothetical protein
MPKYAIDVAIGGKADMTFCGANVCLRPKADIDGLQTKAREPFRVVRETDTMPPC